MHRIGLRDISLCSVGQSSNFIPFTTLHIILLFSLFPFQTVIDWYRSNGRHTLPWRNYDFDIKTLSYRVWLAEVILQQTQASRGALYFENIFKHFPTIEKLAQTSYEEFFPYYDGLGYYSRARNMLAAAKIVTEKYNGVFPNNYEILIKIPGVGPYTAQAIQSFAYQENILSFDTNLEKVFSRYYFGDKYRKLTKDEKQIIQDQFKKTKICGREINNALMDFSSLVSTTKEKVDWKEYSLKNCKWYQTRGGSEYIPEKKSKQKIVGADIIIHLHENHKTYFSENEESYIPFYISGGKENPRETAKAYFLEKFGLSVSVRPPHKNYEKNEKIIVECNAQIQKGKYGFFCFNKNDLKYLTI